MLPWFKNFRGTIAQLGHQKFVCYGEIASLGPNKLEITELPVRTWTNNYKEDMEKLMVRD
jgi:DNA topoisomerase-2